MKHRWSIGEFVTTVSSYEVAGAKGSRPSTTVAWHIIEINIQLCPAGTQIWYTCRPHIPEFNQLRSSPRDWAGNDLRKFNEIELTGIPEPAIDETEDLAKQVADLAKIIRGKEKPMD